MTGSRTWGSLRPLAVRLTLLAILAALFASFIVLPRDAATAGATVTINSLDDSDGTDDLAVCEFDSGSIGCTFRDAIAEDNADDGLYVSSYPSVNESLRVQQILLVHIADGAVDPLELGPVCGTDAIMEGNNNGGGNHSGIRDPGGRCFERVDALLQEFIRLVQQKGAWRVFLDLPSRAPSEAAICALFRAFAMGFRCQAYELDLIPEAETGRGRVDFLFRCTTCRISHKVLVEFKRVASDLRQHMFKQLATYLDAEDAVEGRIVIAASTAHEAARAATFAREMGARKSWPSRLNIKLLTVNFTKPQPGSRA